MANPYNDIPVDEEQDAPEANPYASIPVDKNPYADIPTGREGNASGISADLSSKDPMKIYRAQQNLVNQGSRLLNTGLQSQELQQEKAQAERDANFNQSFPDLLGKSLSESWNQPSAGIARGFNKVGDVVYEGGVNALQHNLEEFRGLPPDTQQDPGLTTPEAIKTYPTPVQAGIKGVEGLVRSAPQMGVAAINPLAGAFAFGATEEGFSPKQAAIAAALPYIGKYAGALTEAIASKAGVGNEAAKLALNKLGGAAGAAGAIGADEVAHIMSLPEDERKDAWVNAVGNVGGMFLLGTMGERHQFGEKAVPKPAQFEWAKTDKTPAQLKDLVDRGNLANGLESVALDPATGNPISNAKSTLEKADARIAELNTEKERTQNAGNEPSPARLPESEVRAQVGPETSLRQQGQAATPPPLGGASDGTIVEPKPQEGEIAHESGAKFVNTTTKSGRQSKQWVQTKFGKRAGDVYNDGDAARVIAVRDTSTPGLDGEYKVKTYGELLGPNEIEVSKRDMTPDEIKAKQEKLRKDNETRREFGIPEVEIPEPPKAAVEPKPAEAQKVEAPVAKSDSEIRLELDAEKANGTITPERDALREKYIAAQKARDKAGFGDMMAQLKARQAKIDAEKAAADKSNADVPALEARGYDELRRSKMTPEQKAEALSKPIPTLEEDQVRNAEIQDALESEKDPAKRQAIYDKFGVELELLKKRNTKNPGFPPDRPSAKAAEPKNAPEPVSAEIAPTETPEQSVSLPKVGVESFLEPFEPMQRGKAKKSLEKEVVNGGKVYKISDLVGNRVSKGAKIEARTVVDETARKKLQAEYDRTRGNYPIGNQVHPETIRFNKVREELKSGGPRIQVRELTNPDGSYLSEKNIGKTAIDYAEHLIRERDRIASETQAPEQSVSKPVEAQPPPIPPQDHTGMGAAVPSEFQNSPQTPTGIKNATVDAERAKRGLKPAMEPAKRSFGKVWDEAMATVDKNPGVQDELIKELKFKPRALTDLEDALLLHRQVDLQNEYGKATRDLAQAHEDGRLDAVVEEKARVARFSDQLQELYNINKRSGTETARGLNARKMMAYEDFTLANMELQKRASANEGGPLNDAQREELTSLYNKIDDLQKKLDEATAKAEAGNRQGPVTDAVTGAVKKARGEAAIEKANGEVRDLEAEKKEAIDFINESNTENGGLQESTSAIKKLMEIFARQGITERLPMEDAVMGVLKEIKPDITREQTQDLMSGYGKSRLPSQDAAKKVVRDINAQVLSVRKLLDYFQNKRPKLTGQLRDVPSQIQRDLLRMVNEAKKSFHLEGPGDNARAVKSALDAVNTRLKNRLADLKSEIVTRRKIINERSPSPYNEETLRLRKELEETQKIHDEIFGTEMSDAKRIQLAERATERQIAELERQIKTGEIFPKSKVERNLRSEKLDAAKARLEELKKTRDFARDSAQPKMEPEAAFLLNYELRLRRRAAEYQDRLAKGDFAQKVRRETPVNAAVMKAGAEVEAAKQEFQRGLLRDRLAKRTLTEKAQDTFVKWRRGFILSGTTVLAKLTSAAAQRMGISALEEGIGAGISKLPLVNRVARLAPREGGASVRAEAKALTDGFTKGMADSWNILKTGKSELDLNYGKSHLEDRSLIDLIGSIHGALKAPTKRAEFARSLEKRFAHGLANGLDVYDPAVQARISLDAYKDAQRSIFMNDNRVVGAYKRAMSAFDEKSKVTGEVPVSSKAASTAAKVLLPIVKIPTNIVAETFQYAIGSVTGSARLANAFRKGVENLHPDQADLIMRDLKKGSLGAAALLLGFFAADSIGGYYQPGDKRDKKDVGYGKIRLFGFDIPSYLTHNPLLEVLQMGATVRRVADSRLKKKDENTQGIGSGLMAGAFGLAEEIPFAREAIEATKLFNPRERMNFLGELAKSITVPQLLQEIAGKMDTNAAGEKIKRKPETFMEHIKSGIPGLRESVPVSGASKQSSGVLP